MITNQPQRVFSPTTIAEENARFMSRVYSWMAGGLLISGGISYYIGTQDNLAMAVVQNRGLFWVMIIAQLAAVFYLSARHPKDLCNHSNFFVYGLRRIDGRNVVSNFFSLHQGKHI